MSIDILRAAGGSGNRNDELTDTHSNGAEEQELTSTELLDEVQAGKSRDNVDGVGDDLNDEASLSETCVLEVLGSVVEDKVLSTV